MQTVFFGLILLVSYCNGLIVPQELPSVLSVIYSSIPIVKKGTDSRLGFGFRLGNHADFQTIIEIGPQKYTKPLGKSDGEDSSGTSKRMADQINYNKPIKSQPSGTSKDGSNFLQKWANEMAVKSPTKANKPQIDSSAENDSLKILFTTRDQFPIPKSPVVPESSLRQLQQLMYAKQSDADKGLEAVGTLPSKTMEAHIALAARENAAKLKRDKIVKANLSDVSLDD